MGCRPGSGLRRGLAMLRMEAPHTSRSSLQLVSPVVFVFYFALDENLIKQIKNYHSCRYPEARLNLPSHTRTSRESNDNNNKRRRSGASSFG